MTDNDTTQTGGTIIDFASRTGRIGFNLAPTTTLDSPVVAPPNAVTSDPDAASSSGRRSPLDILATLAHPGVRQPVIAAPGQLQPDNAPATFRSEPAGDLTGPRMGALSLAAILAVAVAALRGSHTVASTWWERRQARSAEGDQLREARLKHQLAMQGIHDKAAQQRAKKVPASHEFGRKTLNRSSGARSGGSGSGGGGRGSSNRSSGLSSGSGSGRKGSSGSSKTGRGGSSGGSKTKGALFGGGSGSGSGKSGGGRGSGGAGRGPKPKGPKSPYRTSQGGGAALKKAGSKRGPASGKGKDTGGRTTLAGALKKDTHKGAERRLKQRRNGVDKPVLWKDGQAGGKKADLKKQTPKNKNSKTNGKVNGSGKAQQNTSSKKTQKSDPSKPDQARWNDIKKAAQRRWKKRQKPAQNTPTADGTNTKQAKNKAKKASWWAKARDYARNHGTKDNNVRDMPRTGPNAGTSGSGAGGRSGGRRSPFENVGQGTAGTTYTVERDDYPGAQAKRGEPDALTTGTAALDAATTPHTQRPGTTRPKEPNPMPPAPVPARTDPRIVKARKQAARTGNAVAGRQMDAQHATEITLDDAIDEYGDFKDDAFKTHDQSAKLANRARKLRDTLVAFAEDLAVNHNLIGPLFSAAMARMAESMDLVARMSDEMQTSSLQAAEMSETADNDLNDTYRPYNVATADAGLTTPSAPIHNET